MAYGSSMREKAFLFGDPPILLGITSEPPTSTPAPQRPAFLILNAGLVHRVGPARKSVRLARRLAADGYLTMRFHLSGIGDSEPRRDTLSFDERDLRDALQATDHLQRTHGVGHCVATAVCQGRVDRIPPPMRD